MSEKNMRRQRPGGIGHGPMGMGRGFEKPKDFKGTFSKLLNYLKPYRLKLIVVMIFAIGSTAFTIRAPKTLGKATTKIFQGLVSKVSGSPDGGIDFQYILNIIFLLVGLYVMSAIFSFIQGFIVTGVAQKVSYNLRKEISEKVNKLPLKYFDSVSYGDVLSRVTNDVDTISQTLNQSMSQIITSATTLVGVLIMMISISWQMTIAAILILPISMILVMSIIKRSQKFFKEQQNPWVRLMDT